MSMYSDLTDYPDRNFDRESKILMALCNLCEVLRRKQILSEDDLQEIINAASCGIEID